MTQIAQPLALIVDSESETQRDTPRATSPLDRDETRPTGLGTTRQTERSYGDMSRGEIYVLVFDPADPQSQSAYQQAQSIAQAGARPSLDRPESPLGAQRRPLSPGADQDATRTTGIDRDADRDADRERVRDQDRQYTTPSFTGMQEGESVKVTGRVIEREGLQAIAVQSVERKTDHSPAQPRPFGTDDDQE